MTVEPGFGGQKFMHDMLPKIEAIRGMIEAVNPACELEVDGGIDPETAPLVKQAGANVLVAGSAVFNKSLVLLYIFRTRSRAVSTRVFKMLIVIGFFSNSFTISLIANDASFHCT